MWRNVLLLGEVERVTILTLSRRSIILSAQGEYSGYLSPGQIAHQKEGVN